MHGNKPGDPQTAPRCGAKTRRGTSCQAPAMRGKKRCRLHGGKSTGPKTVAGKVRSSQNAFKHGRRSIKAEEDRKKLWADLRAVTYSMKDKGYL
ncbi:MAG: hypothetical protein HOG95_00060 [Rhodospirillaceae bacterium]|nr:hypothetical protein [Rhodospirillaceae bacterium]MBT5938287.1 hypothetical protein [Rhodospirillaceae bacterium]MBT7267923.1 hypothetical protein [Rhodospirillaceae bacterium]